MTLNYEYVITNPLWEEVRCCLKHYPGEFDMERAAEQAPEIFGDWEYYKHESQN